MKKRLVSISLVLISVFTLMLGAMACGKKKTVYDNEKDILVMSVGELDGVFNPFFSTSAYDGEVIGLTQLPMLSIDRDGEIAVGENEPTVVLDRTTEITGNNLSDTEKKFEIERPEDSDKYYTTYKFLIKNGLKFSDGSDLTVDDILFNLYVYLDPVFMGSATMYSTKIQGLKAYRAQDADATTDLDERFEREGEDRYNEFIEYTEDDPYLHPDSIHRIEKEDGDLDWLRRFYLEELNADWSMAASYLEEYETKFPGVIDSIWQVYLILQNRIEIKKDKDDNDYVDLENSGYVQQFAGLTPDEAKARCISLMYDYVLGDYVSDDDLKDNIRYVLTSRSAGLSILDYFVADQKTIYFKNTLNEDGSLKVPSISGITVSDTTSFNNKSLGESHKVLQIRINGVDPKAIYNFSFSVVPKKYYAGLGQNHNEPGRAFGVKFSDADFMFNTVRAQRIPIGAGPYKATNIDHGTPTDINEFYSQTTNMVYYIRNDHFLLGAPKIKLIRYKIIARTQLFAAVQGTEVDVAEPDAKQSVVERVALDGNLTAITLNNLGYGYVGINAKYIPDINVRKAIMHAMNMDLAIEFYNSILAEPVERSMSKVLTKYYPSGKERCYPYDPNADTIRELIKEYQKRDGLLYDQNGNPLKYTFTIAGDSTDHPMYNTFMKAAEILNGVGFQITVSKDPNALRKLSSGLLTVWAAAWGSTIDPDLYQVYHMDSKATAILNWGYKEMLEGTNEIGEKQVIRDLARLIEQGRETLNENERKQIYSEALDKIMDLAIELPAYQRRNLYVFKNTKIDVSTLFQNPTAFKGPLAEIWNVSFITE